MGNKPSKKLSASEGMQLLEDDKDAFDRSVEELDKALDDTEVLSASGLDELATGSRPTKKKTKPDKVDAPSSSLHRSGNSSPKDAAATSVSQPRDDNPPEDAVVVLGRKKKKTKADKVDAPSSPQVEVGKKPVDPTTAKRNAEKRKEAKARAKAKYRALEYKKLDDEYKLELARKRHAELLKEKERVNRIRKECMEHQTAHAMAAKMFDEHDWESARIFVRREFKKMEKLHPNFLDLGMFVQQKMLVARWKAGHSTGEFDPPRVVPYDGPVRGKSLVSDHINRSLARRRAAEAAGSASSVATDAVPNWVPLPKSVAPAPSVASQKSLPASQQRSVTAQTSPPGNTRHTLHDLDRLPWDPKAQPTDDTASQVAGVDKRLSDEKAKAAEKDKAAKKAAEEKDKAAKKAAKKAEAAKKAKAAKKAEVAAAKKVEAVAATKAQAEAARELRAIEEDAKARREREALEQAQRDIDEQRRARAAKKAKDAKKNGKAESKARKRLYVTPERPKAKKAKKPRFYTVPEDSVSDSSSTSWAESLPDQALPTAESSSYSSSSDE